MSTDKLISRLGKEIEFAIKHGEPFDKCSCSYQEGVIITVHEDRLFIELLRKEYGEETES